MKKISEEVSLQAKLGGLNKGQYILGESIDKLAKDIEKYPSRYTGITKGQRKRADKKKKEDKN